MAQKATQTASYRYSPLKPRNLQAFDQLIGMEEAKQEVMDFFDISIAAIENPASVDLYRLKPAKGLLLYGPPGTGKTAFARACAQFYGLKIAIVKGSEILADCSLVGEPQQRIKNLFDQARLFAPCLIFMDEIDAICQRRTGGAVNTPSELILNNLLAHIDGYHQTTGIFIIGATNRPDIIDPALFRPGRLEKQIYIGLPDLETRQKIFHVYLQNRPVSDINTNELARLTEKQSGAFIEAVVNRAATMAWRDQRPICQYDLRKAIAVLR
jgi:SpoVK/Ycf46/Vps4 family AAA+-type ATPase